MPKHELDTLSEVMNKLKEEGYSEMNFDGKGLTFNGEEKSINAAHITIEDEYRFEGATNPGDLSILYAVKTDDGEKGIVVNNYGPDANLELNDYLKQANDNTNDDN